MFSLIKREKIEDEYELTKSVKLVDVKGYLQKEYERANQREELIQILENKIEELKKIEIKYDAMLVVQEETQKRIERQDGVIKELREKLNTKNEEIKLSKSKQIDIKVNAENKLKEKDKEIKELKNEIRTLKKQYKVK